MTEPQQVLSYDELMAAVRERVAAVGAPLDIVEELAGMTRGHLGKVLGRAQSKRMGLFVIWPLFETLGLRLAIVEHLDLDATREEMGENYRPTAHFAKRGRLRKQISPAIVSTVARELGARGGSVPKRFGISPERRSEIYRANANKRWQRPVGTTADAVSSPG